MIASGSCATVHVRGLVHRVSPLVRLAPAKKVRLKAAGMVEGGVSFYTFPMEGVHRAVCCGELRGAVEPKPGNHLNQLQRGADGGSLWYGLGDGDEAWRGTDGLPLEGWRWG